jgi:CPA2 family monovalent cation:H+ antiporter-2
MMHQTLLRLGYPEDLIEEYAAAIRRDHYELSISSPEEQEVLGRMLEVGKGVYSAK